MSDTMLAGVFVAEGIFELQQRPLPALPGPDWVLVENEGCGMCGTDLHILATPQGHPATPGAILGHEFVGYVVETGAAVTQVKTGQRVAVAPDIPCGLCRHCKAGRPNHCQNGLALGVFQDGAFARYTAVPERALHKLSPAVPFEEAVWTEPLACVVNCTDRLAILPGQTAVIIGAGPIGGLHGLIFKAAGARVIIADVAHKRLEVAQRAGLDLTVNVKDGNLAEMVQAYTHGLGADVVVDAVGSQFATCVDVVAKGGKVALFGMNETARPAIKQYDITHKELTIYGTYVGAFTFPRAIQILESGAIRPSIMNSLILPLPEIMTGIAAARRREAMKVIVKAR